MVAGAEKRSVSIAVPNLIQYEMTPIPRAPFWVGSTPQPPRIGATVLEHGRAVRRRGEASGAVVTVPVDGRSALLLSMQDSRRKERRER